MGKPACESLASAFALNLQDLSNHFLPAAEQRECATPWLDDDLTPSTTLTDFYDSLSRRTDPVYSNGFEYHYPYAAAGNRLTQTTGAPHVPRGVTTYEHDALGRTLSTTVNAPASPLTTCTFLDKLGNATDRLDPKGIDTRYEYDQLNPLTAVVENDRPAAFLPNADTNVRPEYFADLTTIRQ